MIASKAVAFGEALTDSYDVYVKQMLVNAKVMAKSFTDLGYKVVSGGTDNHSMLIDLRTKLSDVNGKQAENALVAADITLNKNMVPFDTRSPFQTSGFRVGTPALTTRGVKEDAIPQIVEMIDRVLTNIDNQSVTTEVRQKVNKLMSNYPLFAY